MPEIGQEQDVPSPGWRSFWGWCALGGAIVGLAEGLHVVSAARLGLGVPGVVALVVIGTGTGGVAAAITGLLASLVPPLRRAQRAVPFLLGALSALSVAGGVLAAGQAWPVSLPIAPPWIGALAGGTVFGVGTAALRVAARYRFGLRGMALLTVLGAAGWGVGERHPVPNGRTSGLERPNVLLITMAGVNDTVLERLGADVPALNSLVAEGTRFTAATAPGTGAPRAAWDVLTARAPSAAPVDDTLPTLGQRLAGAGYAVGAFLASPMPDVPSDGFHTWDDDGSWPKGVDRITAGRLVGLLGGQTTSKRRAGDVAERVARWLDVRTGTWFAWVHLDDATPPYDAPVPFDARYVPSADPRSGTAVALAERAPLDPRHGDSLDGVHDAAWVTGRYLGEVAYMDAQIARILAAVETRGWTAKTLVVLVGVEGTHLAQGDVWFGRGAVLDEGVLDVPAVMRLPGQVPVGREVSTPVELADLGATLLDYLDQREPPGGDAVSLRHTVEGTGVARSVARACTGTAMAVRGDGLIVGFTEGVGLHAARVRGERSTVAWTATQLEAALDRGCGPVQPAWDEEALRQLSEGLRVRAPGLLDAMPDQ